MSTRPSNFVAPATSQDLQLQLLCLEAQQTLLTEALTVQERHAAEQAQINAYLARVHSTRRRGRFVLQQSSTTPCFAPPILQAIVPADAFVVFGD